MTTFFSLMRGEGSRYHYKRVIISPPAKRHLNWRADDGPLLNAGWVALWFSGDPDQYWSETLYFCDFSRARGGGGPDPYSGSAHAYSTDAYADHVHELWRSQC